MIKLSNKKQIIIGLYNMPDSPITNCIQSNVTVDTNNVEISEDNYSALMQLKEWINWVENEHPVLK